MAVLVCTLFPFPVRDDNTVTAPQLFKTTLPSTATSVQGYVLSRAILQQQHVCTWLATSHHNEQQG